jgi:hypothetical protein
MIRLEAGRSIRAELRSWDRRNVWRCQCRHSPEAFRMETSWPMPSLMALDFSDAALQQRAEADRREADPPIQVEAAAWSDAGTLDLVGEERQAWWGRVRGADGRQRWIKAVDLRPAPSADCWCCESHATSCPRTTGRESNRYKAHATSGVAFLARRCTFHCVNMNSRPDCMKAPAEPVGRLSRVVPCRSAASPPASVRLHHRRRQPAPRRSHAGPS